MRISIYNRTEAMLKEKCDTATAILFSPLLWVARKSGLSPDITSFSGFLVALVFFLLLSVLRTTSGTGVVLLVYVLIDNFDGTLARTGQPREAGVLVDIYFDVASLLVGIVALISAGMLPLLLGVGFFALYLFIMWGGIVATSSHLRVLILRPRIIIFICYGTNSLAGRQILDLPFYIAIGIALQIVSAVSIAAVLIPARKALQRPQVLDELPAGTRLLMGTALLLLVPVCLWGLLVPVETMAY